MRLEQVIKYEYMHIKILVTGGTFDKEYDEHTGQLFFKSTHLGEMLRRGRCNADVAVETLMMIDSLDMTDKERKIIEQHCRQAEEKQMLLKSSKIKIHFICVFTVLMQRLQQSELP